MFPTVDTQPHRKNAPAPSIEGAMQRWLSIIPPLKRTMKASIILREPRQARREIAVALMWGAVCHGIFAAAVVTMIVGMWFGMSRGLGTVPYPWSWLANALLLGQFPLAHSFLLTARGQKFLGRLAPYGAGATLSTTTYAIIASVQLLLLFALWTPSGIILWQATGWSFWLVAMLYAVSWLFLIKASWDAGAELQSGLLGWMSLFRSVKPQYPPMPTKGSFKSMRHPIYLAFALTTWTVPNWTLDQLCVAVVLTLYCAIGPLAKERRFAQRYGSAWTSYRLRTPYWAPRLSWAHQDRSHRTEQPDEMRREARQE